MHEQWVAHGFTGALAYLDPFKYVSGIAYSAATVVYLFRHRRDVEHSYSNIERVNLRWLFWFSAATGGIWVLVTGLKIAHVSTAIRDGHVTLAMALLVYGIGYMGLRQPEVFRYQAGEPEQREQIPRIAQDDKAEQRALTPVHVAQDDVAPGGELESAPSLLAPEPETSTPRYERSGLGDVEAMRLKESLLRVMESEQLWKHSELTLADLAAQLNSTPHKVSEVLNSQLGQRFYDFVNGYRVREVQRRIQAGEARSLKMLALAMDAGFASKSSFNEAFKKHTSQTPSDFRQAVGA
jgi:AraC-like DNA-binding protein